MSFLNPEKVSALQIGFNAIFEEQMEKFRSQSETNWELLSRTITTDSPVEQFNWLGADPVFSEWIGDRKLGKLANYNYTITVKDWANGLEVDVNDIEDDKLGKYVARVQGIARQAMLHRINRMVSFLTNGFATTTHGAGYDGLAFFSASHVDGGGAAQSNLVTATLDDSGGFDGAYQKMLEMKDENGEPLHLVPTHLLCGPSNRANARSILVAERGASGATNTNYGVVTPIISPKITDGKWFLLCLSEPVKPLITLMRKEVSFDSVQDGDDAFMRRKLKFGASARYEIGYGMWQMAVGSNAST